ncbi:hypothetical protein CP8484711_1992B, partial [Chlamydia psittaci 84-8471/1]
TLHRHRESHVSARPVASKLGYDLHVLEQYMLPFLEVPDSN